MAPSTVEVPDPQPEDAGNTSTHSSRSSSNPETLTTPSVKYKSIDKSTDHEEKKQLKMELDDPAGESGDQTPQGDKTKATGTLEKRKHLKVCHYLSSESNKVTPMLYTSDSFIRRNKLIKKNQSYKPQTFRLIELGFKRTLFHIGKTVEDYGLLYMIVPIVMAVFSIGGSIFLHDHFSIKMPFSSFVTHPDPKTTAKFTVGLRSLMHSAINFNLSNPVYDTVRRSSPAEFSFILHPRSNYDTVFDDTYLNLYEATLEKTKHLIGDNLKWTQLCRENCGESSQLLDMLRQKELLLTYPEAVVTPVASSKYNFSKLFIGNVIGDCTLDSNNVIQRAGSIMGNVKLKENVDPHVLENFEAAFRRMIDNISLSTVGEDCAVRYWSMRQFSTDVVGALTETHSGLVFCALVLILFCTVICSRYSSYQSRPFVGLQMGIVLLISVACGYAFPFFGRQEFNAISFPAGFMVCSVGVLFFYSYQTTWSRYSMTALHPVEKIAFIASWDGPCMVTTLMCLVFATVPTSYFVENPFISHVLLVAGGSFAALLCFAALSMTLYLYRSGKREAEGVKWFQCCREGDKSFTNKFVPDFDETAAGILHDKLTDLKPCWSRKLGAVLGASGIRVIIAFALAAYLIFACWGLMNISIVMREEDFVFPQSRSNEYMTSFRNAFPQAENYLEINFEEPLDYYDRQRRGDILAMLKWTLDKQYATRVVSWLSDFDRFQQQTIYDVNPDTIVPVVNYVFLASEQFKKYKSDVMFDKFQTQIVKSRMYLDLSPKGMNERSALVNGLLQQARDMGLPVSLNAPFLLSLQHDVQVLPSVLTAFAIISVIMFFASYTLFNNPALALSQLFGSVIANLAVIAGAFYAGFELNIVTLTTALLGDFLISAIILHFGYCFCSAGIRQNTPTLKVQYAFQCSLVPSVMACLTPIVVFLPLLPLQVPVLTHVFKMFLLVAAVSIINLLFFIPGLMIFLTFSVSKCCYFVNKLCEESDCTVAEQTAESIFFIPSSMSHTPKAVAYTHTIGSQGMLMAPPAEETVTLSRTQRRNDRYAAMEESNCDIKSLDSRRDRSTAVSSRHHTPRNDRRTLNRRRGSDVTEEQIYEEPESPPPMSRPTLPMRDFGSGYPPSYHHPHHSRGLPRDEYFRYERSDMDLPGWRPYFVNNQRYPHAPPPPSMLPYPVSSPLRPRRFM